MAIAFRRCSLPATRLTLQLSLPVLAGCVLLQVHCAQQVPPVETYAENVRLQAENERLALENRRLQEELSNVRVEAAEQSPEIQRLLLENQRLQGELTRAQVDAAAASQLQEALDESRQARRRLERGLAERPPGGQALASDTSPTSGPSGILPVALLLVVAVLASLATMFAWFWRRDRARFASAAPVRRPSPLERATDAVARTPHNTNSDLNVRS